MSLYTSAYTGAQMDEGLRRTYEVFANRNLLHNWDFRNPVNQHGQSSYTANGYTLDRWRFGRLSVVGGVLVGNGDITLYDQGDAHSELIELIEGVTPKTDAYTFSADISAFVQGSAPNSVRMAVMRQDYAVNYGEQYVNSTGIASLTVELPAGAEFMVGLFCYKGASMTVKRVKLELGSVSTLANDPPADFGVELAKCQRFLRVVDSTLPSNVAVVGHGYAALTTKADIFVNLSPSMRMVPSIQCTPSEWMLSDGASNHDITAISVSTSVSTRDILTLNVTSSGLAANRPYVLVAKSSGKKFIISAEL